MAIVASLWTGVDAAASGEASHTMINRHLWSDNQRQPGAKSASTGGGAAGLLFLGGQLCL